MVISVSRRTDIPAFYSEWFLNRIKAGYVDVINPFNSKQANRISLKNEDIDCFVFWTKNPKPLLDRINELNGFNYYFQYTINNYESDMEPNVPNHEELINTFIELSNKIGKEKVIWRYDPIILTNKYTKEWHIKSFDFIAQKLHNHTRKCVFSFVDLYAKTKGLYSNDNIDTIDENDICETLCNDCKNCNACSDVTIESKHKNTCPECGSTLRFEGGCVICVGDETHPGCGWSKCD